MGCVVGVVQWSEQIQQEIYLLCDKIVYVVDDSFNDSFEGLGLFCYIVELVQRLCRYEELEGWGFEIDFRGIFVGKVLLQEFEEVQFCDLISVEDKIMLLFGMLDFICKYIKML